MNDFISIKDALPAPCQEVEVLRDHTYAIANPSHTHYGCRYSVDRTVAFAPNAMPAIFACDVADGGKTTHWRPAETQLGFTQEIPAFLRSTNPTPR